MMWSATLARARFRRELPAHPDDRRSVEGDLSSSIFQASDVPR
jgi:hypothetical protein